jgi:hypothetical protein
MWQKISLFGRIEVKNTLKSNAFVIKQEKIGTFLKNNHLKIWMVLFFAVTLHPLSRIKILKKEYSRIAKERVL